MSAEPLPDSTAGDLGITRRGRRVAVIVPAEDAERLEHAEDNYLARLATEARAEVEAGGAPVPWETAKAELDG